MIRAKKIEETGRSIKYEVFIHNRTNHSYSDVGIDYCIYVESVRLSGGKSNQVKCTKGTFPLASLPANARLSLQTIEVPLPTEYENITKSYTNTDSLGYEHNTLQIKKKKTCQDKPAGVWLRITGPTVAGKKVPRDVCLPASLSKEFKWTKDGSRKR